MPVRRIVGLLLVVAGAILLWQGWETRQSVGSRLVETLRGTPSSDVLWLLGVGAVVAVIGVVLAARG